MGKLTPLQEKFKNNLLKGMPQQKAYEEAGYKARGRVAEAAASRLLSNVKFKFEYEKALTRAANKAEVTKERVLKEYARIAFLDPRELFNDDGSLKDIKSLSDDVAACIGGVDVVEIGGDKFATIKKIKIVDKLRALQDVGKHLGMFEKDNEQRKAIDVPGITLLIETLKKLGGKDYADSVTKKLIDDSKS